MHENRELLSVHEVRERVINGKTLILNLDANWNHKESKTKENYIFLHGKKFIQTCKLHKQRI